MKVVSKKLRDSARGQLCTLQIAGVCNYDPETTVLAHLSPGGMGTKCSDLDAAFACSACHARYDGQTGVLSAEDKAYYARRANINTLHIWLDMGLITVAGHKA